MMTSSKASPAPPPAVWRWLGLAAVLLLLVTMTFISLISTGLFDPQPLGQEESRQTLEARMVAAGEIALLWTERPLPDSPSSLRLVAAAGPESAVGYGLAVGQPDLYLAAAVSSAGYVALWQQQRQERTYLLPWQPWPHTRPGAANEIQVDSTGEQVTVRINRELLWQGTVAPSGRQVALLGQGFAEPGTVLFQTLTHFE